MLSSDVKTNTNGKSVEKDTNDKGIEKESSKVNLTTKCYKCQSFGHIAANCSNLIKITFVNGVLVAKSESNSDEFVYQEKEDSDIDEEIIGDGVGFNCIRPTSSTQLSVVKCVSSQPTEKDD